MTKYIIKLHGLYFDKWANKKFSMEPNDATAYAHQDVANNDIESLKLPKECTVHRIDILEQEV